MKAAIFLLALAALFGGVLVRIVAYLLKKSWTKWQIDAVSAAIRWAALGVIILLAIDVLIGF